MVHPRAKAEGSAARDAQSRLAEAVGLAQAIALSVVAAESVPLIKPKPATLFGSGTVERLGEIVKERAIDLAVIDARLSPVQQRNLEKAWGCKVIDRTGLILEIFGARARTREGRLQVELAALTYQKSRLVRSWTHLERQRGGFGFLGGPGETQIETDRRLIGERIAKLGRELDEVRRTRDLHRRARRRVPYPIVALVGYTNAGKSTLFNALTRATVYVQDQLFATLDPTMRGLDLPSGRTVILSDTVGFVSDLPHELVAAFRATLEEVLEADLVLHVRDIAHPDSDSQKSDVETVLRELGLETAVEQGLLEVWNKIDLLAESDRDRLLESLLRQSGGVAVSALAGTGLDDLKRRIDAVLAAARHQASLDVPIGDGAALAWLYAHGEVLERRDDDTHAHLTVRLDPPDLDRFRQRFAQGSRAGG
ncbi:MAG: GTPase HflX [Rhodospirillales bacterium]|nr:GTPase HflX [Rhodospirillales bacterium]